ncbi:hypothetical protein KEM54_002051 [Ascosphaera aggregata]|nr:hypothetical protein KEM54_002051 [Ascosphaera aggregata]
MRKKMPTRRGRQPRKATKSENKSLPTTATATASSQLSKTSKSSKAAAAATETGTGTGIASSPKKSSTTRLSTKASSKSTRIRSKRSSKRSSRRSSTFSSTNSSSPPPSSSSSSSLRRGRSTKAAKAAAADAADAANIDGGNGQAPNNLCWEELLLDRPTPEPYDWRNPDPERLRFNRAYDAVNSRTEEENGHHLVDVHQQQDQDQQHSLPTFGPWSEDFEARLREFLYVWMKENVHQYPFTPPPEFLFGPEQIREISCTRFPCAKTFLQDYLTTHARNQFAQDITAELMFWIQEEKQVFRHACFDYDDTRKVQSTTFK